MPATSAYAHATPFFLEYIHPKTLLCNDYPAERGFTWVASAKSDNAHRYTVYFWARGYTTALHLAAYPAAFTAGHPTM